MTEDHRYPTEVKRDARRRVTLATHPELLDLLQTTPQEKVLLAGMMIEVEALRRRTAPQRTWAVS